MKNTKDKKPIRILLFIFLGLIGLIILALDGTLLYGLNFKEPAMAKVWKAGYVEKTFTVDETTLNYVEGPEGRLSC